MTNLVLHLKKEYFDQIASGAKVEEYRLATPYWSKRLEGRQYDNVVLLCGYPARGDESRQIVRPWSGYVRKTITHPHFGNSPVEVYAISLAHLTQRPADLGARAHVGDPCIYCHTPHDEVSVGDCPSR